MNPSWRVLALVLGRTLGCVPMMVGSGVHYAVSTWATTSQTALGFTELPALVGVALLVDPWDLMADTLWPMLQRITGDGPYEPIVWNLTAAEVLTRVLRVPWAAAASTASTATVLGVATVYWWSAWILAAVVPAAVATMGYAVLGRNRPVVGIVAPIFTGIAALGRQSLPAADGSGGHSGVRKP